MNRIGVDPGYGNFKVARTGVGGIEVTVVPSVVGVGETDMGLLSTGNVGRRQRRSSLPDRVTFAPGARCAVGGVTYLVGQNVARYARPVQRMDFLRLSDGPELRALFYDAVFGLLGEGRHEAALMVGLPVDVMVDRKQAQATLKALRKWMVGDHHFAVNGVEAELMVDQIRVMAQPAGAFFAWGLDDGGRWARSGGDLKAPVAICDIGFNTLDLFSVEGGEVVGRFTGGDTAGMRRAAELLSSVVKGQYDIDLSLHEADALMRAKSPRLYTPSGEADLRGLVDQARDSAAAGVITFVERRWGNGKQFAHLLFTGGGADALRGDLQRQYPHGVALPNPVGANAIGLARYAQRIFGK